MPLTRFAKIIKKVLTLYNNVIFFIIIKKLKIDLISINIKFIFSLT